MTVSWTSKRGDKKKGERREEYRGMKVYIRVYVEFIQFLLILLVNY
jgi:hypothetical protein